MEHFYNNIVGQSIERDVLAAIVGLCVGSFLNVLALRTLAEKPLWSIIFGSSACPKCDHKLGPLDLIPVISYILLRGKCRYCKKPISWYYSVTEIVTSIAFVAILHHYQISSAPPYSHDEAVRAVGLMAAMLTFFCILITVCVTDFKEKLIPHEITYPSIIIGIAFSAWGREDLMPTLAGIGISYILFDFLAFYGLKIYYWTHRDEEGLELLEHAMRASDKDTLATLPTAKDFVEKEHSEIAENRSSGKTEEEFLAPSVAPAPLVAAEPYQENNELVAHHGVPAIENFEEAAIRSSLMAETEDTNIDSPELRTSAEEAAPEQSNGQLLDFAPPASGLKRLVSDGVTGTADLEPDLFDPEIDEAFGLVTTVETRPSDEEDFEVMGGGDAVLAALIAAWIGLENLGVTLVLGFMFGSLMGSCYLAHELKKRGLLKPALKTTALITIAFLAISEGSVYLFASNTGLTMAGHEVEFRQLPWLALGIASTFGGILMGTIANGKEGSKPFPFGPALAAGAAVAVFVDPVQKIVLSDQCVRLGSFLLDMGHN